mgnify:FL=1
MTTSAETSPRYLSRANLQEFYGLSRASVDGYLRRGLIPPPDAAGSRGHLWSRQALIDARSTMIPTLAAAVPMNALGAGDLDEKHAYMCPARSGHFIGWTSPSIIGLVQTGLALWYRVHAFARYDGSDVYETSTTDRVLQTKLREVRERRPEERDMAVFLLEEEALGIGQIKVSSESTTAGLQHGRLLRRDGNRVGAPGSWLDLPSGPTSTPLRPYSLPGYSLPLLESAFPSTRVSEHIISAT